MSNVCEKCKYWQDVVPAPTPGLAFDGRCVRYPPQWTATTFEWEFPKVFASSTCGEWKKG
jgi:hypothetical protein